MISRSATWSRYDVPLRVNQDVFMDIFRTMFNAIEKQPDIKMKDMIEPILTILEMK